MTYKTAAIFNVYDGVELLKYSIKPLAEIVDVFIFVVQDKSNFGEYYNPYPELLHAIGINKINNKSFLYKFIPEVSAGQPNETKKRQLGIEKAKEHGCTHFIALDCDEIYPDFSEAMIHFINSGADGSVLKMYTYFHKPTLRLEKPDNYYVPFIHKLTPETVTGASSYPFYCDRTRQINAKNVIELPYFMHHYSWVRNDILLKVRNSSARNNIYRSDLLVDYSKKNLSEGYFLKDYGQKLIEVENRFGITI
jgi:hypothetical protein